MQQFRAYVYFCTEAEFYERDITIHFASGSRPQAALDVKRWFENRHEAIPDYFFQLLAVKLCLLELQAVDERGYLGQDSMQVFEWKNDFPGKYEDWVSNKLGVVS